MLTCKGNWDGGPILSPNDKNWKVFLGKATPLQGKQWGVPINPQVTMLKSEACQTQYPMYVCVAMSATLVSHSSQLDRILLILISINENFHLSNIVYGICRNFAEYST